MEHILISPGKLKLMLTKGDLEHYELADAARDGTLSPEARGTHGSLRRLLEDAGKLSGFDAGDDKLFIQLYPSKDGGAELYITRLGGKPPEQLLDDTLTVNRLGGFESMEALLMCADVIGRATQNSESTESSAFAGEGRYYLLISEKMSYHDYLERGGCSNIEAIFGEFGRNIRDGGAINYVKEHCFNFCEKRAVKILSDMV